MNDPICPRCEKEPAIIDPSLGVLPGEKCQAEDAQIKPAELPEFYNMSKSNRIQEQRDKHNADTTQPYLPGKDMKPNPDFIKLYPEMAKEYFPEEQLKKM